jgi:hypothetical protein
MKKVLLTIAAIALFAVPASAQVYSLWGDVEMNSCSAEVGQYGQFDVYLMIEPGPLGVRAAEYMVTGIAGLTSVVSEEVAPTTLTQGAPLGPPGYTCSFASCYTDAFVVWHWTFFNMVAGNTGTIMVGDHETYEHLTVAICDEDRTEADATVYNYFGVNTGCVVATEESSWGAIKSMMD